MALIKYLMLLAITYNDQTPVPESVREEIFEQIYLMAGAYTIAGEVRGAYRMKSGKKQVDASLQIWIAIEQSIEPELRKLAADVCKRLDQETIYLERTGGEVEFIPPTEAEEGNVP